MSMLAIHDAALGSKIASFHEFLLRYSKTKKVIYGFVEGKVDPCFYRGFIEHQIPDGWEVELWPAGNKDQVYRIHAGIDWRCFPKKRVCFFVDRDLSDVIPEKLHNDSNIYVTDGYSIENDLAKKGTCRRVLTEVCGFATADHGELDQVCELFEQQLERFQVELIPIMACVLAWRRSGKPANLNNLLMQELFAISDGVLQVKAKPKGKANAIEYIHSQCNLAVDTALDIAAHETEFRKGCVYRKFTRGKYVFWFLVQFCHSVHTSARVLFKSCAKAPAMNVSMSAANGVTIIGHRARLPVSLKAFLKSTYCDYIAKRPPGQ
jgi:hypothetical protein